MDPERTAGSRPERDPPTSRRPEDLRARFQGVRSVTESLCAPLEIEDFVPQCMPDASPPKWHLAHTTWFFETFLLIPRLARYRPFDGRYGALFNSYYQSVGKPFARPHRGFLSRPTVREVFAYRRHVDDAVGRLLEADGALDPGAAGVLELGIQHEQQHQELLLMDLKFNFSCNPLRPAYQCAPRVPDPAPWNAPPRWIEFAGGNRNVGAAEADFAFDNERPRHLAWLVPFALRDRPVTCGEYLAFMEDGGYRRPELWLADGWDAVQEHGWRAPLYWEQREGGWWHFTLHGMEPVQREAPVCHLGFYEADAFARWSGARLPTEAEWEIAVAGSGDSWIGSLPGANLLESGRFRPAACGADAPAVNGLRQAFGDVWEWTQSSYSAYPGYAPPSGALGEYNGKFMNGQRVLRGGSFATPASHVRPTYRNFFRPGDRWAFAGVRLCRDLS